MNRDIPKPSKRNRLVKNKNKIRRSRFKKKIKHTSFGYNINLKTPDIMNMGDYLDFTKLKKFQPIDSSDVSNVKLTSNWYWSNYKKALEWQDRHKIAHWKACALALQEENRYLMEIIQSFQQGMFPVSANPVQGRRKSRSKTCTKSKSEDNHKQNKKYTKTQNEFDKTDDEEIEFEMSEEMVKFFEESFKKKMDLKKQKEEQESRNDADEQVKKIQLNKLKRLEEMKLLYGEEASKIIGMETAIQLSFDRYCDTKSPKYWPNIPLKL